MSNPISEAHFPAGFLWGAATSAYQIEGSPLADGAGASIWHRFVHEPGRIVGGDTGDLACDHYRRFAGDIALMQEFGLKSYRFSLSWSRILPEGRGRINPAGLAFYERLVDLLLASGIEPFVTLYHWDLPAALHDLGGWPARDSVAWFADYATVMFRALDDRVRYWTTLNEPWVVMDGGYMHGVLAPGIDDPRLAALTTHHLLLAHGAAVEAYRAEGRHQIGIAVNLEPKDPVSQRSEDIAAAARAGAYMNQQYLDPLLLGCYPPALSEIFGSGWIEPTATDLERIRVPIDFLAVNYYTRGLTAHDPASQPTRARNVTLEGAEYSDTGWEVRPESLRELLARLRERYPPLPIYITENGIALPEPNTTAATLEDPRRVDYLRSHLRALHGAIAAGSDVRGYFVWSLLDNFEWAHGFSKRFGLIHVDYATQQRTPKRSAFFYRDVIRSNGVALLADPRS